MSSVIIMRTLMKNVYIINLVLFSNIDELSSRGLIKGLMMLALTQDNMIRNYEQTILKLKKQHSTDIKQKDNEIAGLNNQLDRLKFNIRGCKYY